MWHKKKFAPTIKGLLLHTATAYSGERTDGTAGQSAERSACARQQEFRRRIASLLPPCRRPGPKWQTSRRQCANLSWAAQSGQARKVSSSLGLWLEWNGHHLVLTKPRLLFSPISSSFSLFFLRSWMMGWAIIIYVLLDDPKSKCSPL